MRKIYRTIPKDGYGEIEIKKSRFICSLKRVATEDDAKAFIQDIKKTHWKANHNCSAFLIGDHNEIQRTSDDGEPSGTAGVPMLEVLKKNELINVAAVVTRYFGGTKLGAGGLIRAYSKAVSHTLTEVGLVEGKLQQELFLAIQYPLLGKLQNYLQLRQIAIKDIQYTETITVCIMVDEVQIEETSEALTDLLNGQLDIKVGEKSYQETKIAPINN